MHFKKSHLTSVIALAFAVVILIAGCSKDDVVEIIGVCPLVLSTIPEDGDINIPLDQVISVTFNEELDPATVNTTTFKVNGTSAVAGTVTYSGTTAYFTPSSDLLPNTTYTGTVTTGIKDPMGNALQENYVWSFTTIPQITLSSSPDTSGSTTGAGTFNNGSMVTVAATSNDGFVFTNWTLDTTVVSTSPSYQFEMDGNIALVANFAAIVIGKHRITLSSSPVAGGTTTGSGQYDENSLVAVSALPSTGYYFVNWTEGETVVSTSSSYQFVITGERTLVANYSLIPADQFAVTLSANPAAGGSTSGSGSFDSGTNVTVKATANTGYSFVNWTVNGTEVSTNSEYTFDISENTSLVANFKIFTYTLTVTAQNGTVAKNPNQDSYNHGTEVVLTPTPANGYEFSSWSGDASGSANPLTVTMNANKNITANFTLIPVSYTLTVTAQNGTVAKNPNQDSYSSGAEVVLTPTPADGYKFSSWSGDASGSANPLTVTMDANKNITANFTLITVSYTLTVTAENGTVAKNPNQDSYNSGAEVVLTATPADGYEFSSWSGDATGSENPLTVTMNANKNITANFTLIPVSYTLTVNAQNGTVSKNPNQDSYNSGAEVVLTATPANGYEFSSWSGDATGSENPLTVTMNSNKNITANFTLIPVSYTLTVNAQNGSVSKNPDQLTYNSGTTVQLTATPANGYEFSHWSGDANGTNNPLDVLMDSNKNITANFTQIVIAGEICPNPAVDLGSAGNYAILAESGISTTGTTSVNGDMGLSPMAATGITGFGLIMSSDGTYSTSSSVTGKVYAADYAAPTPANLSTAVDNMHTAFTTANGMAPDKTEYMAGNLNGQTLTSGVYKWSSGVSVTNSITLDGGGLNCAKFVFQIAADLTIANGTNIILTNGAKADNIYWVVAGSGAKIGTNVTFNGNVLSKTLISVNTGSTVKGRLLAQTAVTLNANAIVKPSN